MSLPPGSTPNDSNTRNASSDTARSLSLTHKQNRPDVRTQSRDTRKRDEIALHQFAKAMGMLAGGWLAGRAAFSIRTWGEGIETLVAFIYVPLGAAMGIGVGSLVFHLLKALWQQWRRYR